MPEPREATRRSSAPRERPDRLRGQHARLAFGGDYNPEQWPREVWAQDVDLMRRAGVTTATVGVFSWSMLEPSEGTYEFGWLDRVLDLLHAGGIEVILGTPTAAPPPWFTLAHPEALPVTADGVRLIHGSRDTYNPAAPAYRAAARAITEALARRYADHPALAMWHVHNEYGTVSYGTVTDEAFRGWLRRRYKSLETLNHTWNTAFWSQRYGRWEQIFAPQATQYLPNPAHVLDFKRFSAEVLHECLTEQIQILREVTPGVPVTTNFMLPTWNHYDQWAFADVIDQVSVDHYPDDAGPDGQVQVAFGADLARSFNRGRPWLLMEQATTLIYSGDGPMLVKEPGRMRRNTLQYIARGATGSLFFQWRSPQVGAEFFHSAMVPHTGPDSRIYREVAALGADLGRLAELAVPPRGGRVNSHRVAITWSAEAWWAADTRALPAPDLAFLPAVRAAHAALWELGIGADVIHPDADLAGYDLVLVPSLLPVSDAQAAAIAAFVDSGGHLAVWFMAGTTDEHLRIRPDSYSAAFAGLLGIRVEEHVPLAHGDHVRLADGSTGTTWSEVIHLEGAEAVTTYTRAHPVIASGAPAITQCARGSGLAHYLSTSLAQPDLVRHLRRITAAAGVHRCHPDAGDGMEIVRRYAGADRYLFVFNHTGATRTAELRGVDLLTSTQRDGPTEVAPGEVLVVREQA